MKNKRYFILILVLTVLCVACGKKEEKVSREDALGNLTESGMPIVKEPIKLDIFVNKAPTTADNWNDIMIFNEYEKMTNIDVEWQMVPTDGMAEKRNLVLAGGESLPDAFWGTGMPQSDLLKYGEQGIFIPLNDLIDEHAPNLKKIFEEYPALEKGITMADGNIYALPRYYEPEFTSVHLGARLWIREDWLEALDMESPTTTEEFYQYLKAVKETDLNGNGIHDEVPYGGNSITTLSNGLRGSFGLGNRGLKHPNIDIDPETEDTLRFIPTSDEYKQLLEYLHKLYSEELIEQNIFTIETGQFLAKGSEGLYGSTNYYSPDMLFEEDIGEKYVGAEALEGPNGDRIYSAVNSSVVGVGNFVITNENENPEATVRWVDYFYGEEGSELYFMGFEGVTFERNSEGKAVYLDEILNSPDGKTVEQELIKYLTFPGGGSPSIIKEEYFMGSENSEMSHDQAKKVEPYLIEEVWPAFSLTEEESKIMDSYGTDINKYVTEMRDKFIVGSESLDDWDAYVNEIDKMGLEEYMKVQEAAYERYKDN